MIPSNHDANVQTSAPMMPAGGGNANVQTQPILESDLAERNAYDASAAPVQPAEGAANVQTLECPPVASGGANVQTRPALGCEPTKGNTRDASVASENSAEDDANVRSPKQPTSTVMVVSRGSNDLVRACGLTLAAYATAKGLPEDLLRGMGLKDTKYQGVRCVGILYLDGDGRVLVTRYRLSMTGDRFRYRTGSKRTLYGLNRLSSSATHVTLVEGESDTQTLVFHGQNVLGIPGANTWKDEWAEYVKDFDAVYLVVEPGKGGSALAKAVLGSPIGGKVKAVSLAPYKDVSDLHLANPPGFVEAWEKAKGGAIDLHEFVNGLGMVQRRDDLDLCKSIAAHPNILLLVVEQVRRDGFVGEDRNVCLVYLALTTRFFNRPASVVVKGPSSAGKSELVKRVLKFMPPEAYHEQSSMSDRALIYDDEPLAHRHLVLFEAEGMASEIASYIIRSLLSESCVKYTTVEKTSEGMKPRQIVRQGPTGFITTTTQLHLHPENETRMLSIIANDSAQQTADILTSLANEAAGYKTAKPTDYAPWQALQRSLASVPQTVVVPFAPVLAKLIPPVAVRLRRDMATVLALVRGHALLHHATRERGGNNEIIATIEDYKAMYNLIGASVAEGVGAAVPETVRETVVAVEKLGGQGQRLPSRQAS